MLKHSHFKIYKPYGMLSQLSSNDLNQRNKRFLSGLYDFPEGTMPVGRLDEKSEGLLLLTTNGKLSDTINRSGIEKGYYALLDGEITDTALAMLAKGVEIGFEGKRYTTKNCKVSRLLEPPKVPEQDAKLRLRNHRPTSWIEITISEGKFRQVRKMTAAVGFPTLRLIRFRIGDITLDEMIPREVLPILLPLS